MTDSTFQSCSILLLAGGRGQRMGGQDKAAGVARSPTDRLAA